MRTQAIIIRKRATGEYDQLVSCYTEQLGKVTAIAKGILRHSSLQAMHLDDLNLVEFELIDGRHAPIIAAAQVIRTHRNIKASLQTTAMASFFTEVLHRMVFDGERDDRFWEFLIRTFADLEDAPASSVVTVFRKRQTELLDILGYLPRMHECALCGVPAHAQSRWALGFEVGGLICGDCFSHGVHGVLIGEDDIALLRDRVTNGAHATYSPSVLDATFQYIAGMHFTSLNFLSHLTAQAHPVVE